MAGDAAGGVEQAGDEPGQHTGQNSGRQGDQRGASAGGEQGAHGAAGGQGAVYCQIRHIQDLIGDVYADGHNAPDETLTKGAGHGAQKGEKEVHVSIPPDLKWGGDAGGHTRGSKSSGRGMPRALQLSALQSLVSVVS